MRFLRGPVALGSRLPIAGKRDLVVLSEDPGSFLDSPAENDSRVPNDAMDGNLRSSACSFTGAGCLYLTQHIDKPR
jgi:hypothetical protein